MSIYDQSFFGSCEENELFHEEDEQDEPAIARESPFVEQNTLGGSVSQANAIDSSSTGEPMVVEEVQHNDMNQVAFLSTIVAYTVGEVVATNTGVCLLEMVLLREAERVYR